MILRVGRLDAELLCEIFGSEPRARGEEGLGFGVRRYRTHCLSRGEELSPLPVVKVIRQGD